MPFESSLIPFGMQSAWLLPLLGLLAFFIIVLWGRYLPGEGAFLAILAIAIAFALFWPIAADFLARGPARFEFTWLYIPPLGATGFVFPGFQLFVGLNVDALAVVMLGIVTFVAFMVQVYSLGYMRGEPRFGWYFAAHSLFAAAMLTLVLADNFLLLYVAWELVGLCSYLLIGFWYERRSAAEAAKKAFVTTRIGDVGLLIGILLLLRETGTFAIPDMLEKAHSGAIDPGLLTLAALLVFSGAIGKSAQFPLHVWLPDAMEGPTPVSALIHAATMVAAGVYLVARTFPLFAAAPGALEVVTVIGLVTTIGSGLMALVMDDIKRIIAYSTISKLGFMMVALGSGAAGLTAAIFYLMTHAFFKALLFLGAGSVMHSTGKQNIWEMGGLARKMPLTATTFVIAALALAGLPPLSGFWSKDEILNVVLTNQHPIVFTLMLISAFLGSLYVARPCFVVFFGKPRSPDVHPHESPGVMLWPMAGLALLSVVGGLVAIENIGAAIGLHGSFGSLVYAEEPESFHLNIGLAVAASVLALLGIGVAWTIYSARLFSAEALASRLGPIYIAIRNKFYLDDLYQKMIDSIVLVLARFVALFDRRVVNDTGVDGTGNATVFAGFLLKFQQTGKFYNYALAMVVGVVVIVLATGVLQR